MIDVRYKPMNLPQVSAPFTYMLNGLENQGVDYQVKKVNPSDLVPSQGLVALDKISDIDINNIKPIWISRKNEVLDGHHRYGAALSHGLPEMRCVQIMLNKADAIRVLNKIQDIFEYEQQHKMEEVVSQDILNAQNDPDFMATLEELNADDEERNLLLSGDDSIVGSKKKKMSAYRKGDMNEESSIGNFFMIKPENGTKKYDLEFDNLLDTDDMEMVFNRNESPVITLCKKWFPHIEFDKISKKHEIPSDSLMNRAVAEKAKKMGYDGIKYGDILIQGF